MEWVELYAGCGGASLGVDDAGGKGVAHVEWDRDAAATLRAAGFGPVFEMDVADWTREHGASFRGVGGMWASTPCQPFSTAGKRLGALDPRNGWPTTFDAIDEVRPTWLVGEQVPGLASHTPDTCGDVHRCAGCYHEGVILPSLRERFAWVDVWRLDSASWGVPQHRRRLFIVAGPRYVQPPAATHADPRKCLGLFSTFKPWVTSGEALGVSGKLWTGQNTDIKGGGRGKHLVSTDEPSPSVRSSSGMYVLGGGRNASDGTRSYRDLTDEPCTTVAASPSGNAGPWVCDGSDDDRRALTLDELAKLQGFPPGHPWVGNITSRRRQTGNAVPPRLAEAVVRSIIAADSTNETPHTARHPTRRQSSHLSPSVPSDALTGEFEHTNSTTRT